MTSFDLPNFDDCYGKNKPCFLNQMGLEAKPTDFAILNKTNYETMTTGNSCWLTNPSTRQVSNDYYGNYYCNCFLYEGGHGYDCGSYSRESGIRPVIKYSELLKYPHSEEYEENGFLKINAFKWPNDAVDRESYLEVLNKGTKSADCFIVDNMLPMETNGFIAFTERILPIYSYNGNEYVFFFSVIDPEFLDFYPRSLIEKSYHYRWYCLNVNDVVWLIDKENDIAMTEKVIIRNIQVDYAKEYLDKYLFQRIERKPGQISVEEACENIFNDPFAYTNYCKSISKKYGVKNSKY